MIFTPVIREAPFVYYDGRQFRVFRPSAQFNVRGPNWSTVARQGDSLPRAASTSRVLQRETTRRP